MKNLFTIIIFLFFISCQIKHTEENFVETEKNKPSNEVPETNILPEQSFGYDSMMSVLRQSVYLKSCNLFGIYSGRNIYRVEMRTIDSASKVLLHEVFFTDNCDNLFSREYHLWYYSSSNFEFVTTEDLYQGAIEFNYQFDWSDVVVHDDIGRLLLLENRDACNIDSSFVVLDQYIDTSNLDYCFVQQSSFETEQVTVSAEDYSVRFSSPDTDTSYSDPWSFYLYDYFHEKDRQIDEISDLKFFFAQSNSIFDGSSAYFSPVGFQDRYDFKSFPIVKYQQFYSSRLGMDEDVLYIIDYNFHFHIEDVISHPLVDQPVFLVKVEVERAQLTPLTNDGVEYIYDESICHLGQVNTHSVYDVLSRGNCSHFTSGEFYTYMILRPQSQELLIGEYKLGESTTDGLSANQRISIEDNTAKIYFLNY